tara:strand:- start:424 stop:927 length:504 start_codon:yes stop_codon:yes gene_type:complete
MISLNTNIRNMPGIHARPTYYKDDFDFAKGALHLTGMGEYAETNGGTRNHTFSVNATSENAYIISDDFDRTGGPGAAGSSIMVSFSINITTLTKSLFIDIANSKTSTSASNLDALGSIPNGTTGVHKYSLVYDNLTDWGTDTHYLRFRTKANGDSTFTVSEIKLFMS